MIMKANKQIGFIYKNEESIDRILKDSEVVFEKGFLREKTSTTLPITFGGVGKDLKDYKVYGNTVQSKLPSGYTQVDYIESSGTQYIDTGFKGNQDTSVNIKVNNIDTNTPGNKSIIGSRVSATSEHYGLTFSPGATPYLYSGYNNQSSETVRTSLNTIYEIIKSKNIVYLDGIEIKSQTYATFETPTNMYLFAMNQDGATFQSKLRLYYCKIYDDNILVRNFIPCYRNSDNEVGLYDIVNNVFYTNQGTGVFTYGSIAPTPDAPIDMVSCGDKTKNLLNVSSIETGTKNGVTCSYNNKTQEITFNGTCTADNTRFAILNNSIPFTLGNTNICAYLVNNGNNSGNGLFRVFADNYSTYDYLNLTLLNDVTRIISKKTASTITKTIFDFRFDNGAVLDNFTIKLMITDSEDTSYEPYGYKIPVNVRSENLFDKDNANISNWLIQNSTHAINANSNERCIICKVKPNTTYTIKKMVTNRFRLGEYPTIPTTSDILNNYKIDNSDNLTTTTLSNTNYLIINIVNVSNQNYNLQDTLDSIMIVEGSTVPSKYIPYYNETTNIYLDEPLRKIGEYSDYIDFKNGKVVRQLGEVIFDGAEEWSRNSTSSTGKYRFQIALSNILSTTPISEKGKIFSSHFRAVSASNTWSDVIGISYRNVNVGGFYIYDGIHDVVADFKTWLSNNNVTVDYVLETPTEKDIELPNIPTIYGNNTLNIETEITPSQVYIKYKSNT